MGQSNSESITFKETIINTTKKIVHFHYIKHPIINIPNDIQIYILLIYNMIFCVIKNISLENSLVPVNKDSNLLFKILFYIFVNMDVYVQLWVFYSLIKKKGSVYYIILVCFCIFDLFELIYDGINGIFKKHKYYIFEVGNNTWLFLIILIIQISLEYYLIFISNTAYLNHYYEIKNAEKNRINGINEISLNLNNRDNSNNPNSEVRSRNSLMIDSNDEDNNRNRESYISELTLNSLSDVNQPVIAYGDGNNRGLTIKTDFNPIDLRYSRTLSLSGTSTSQNTENHIILRGRTSVPENVAHSSSRIDKQPNGNNINNREVSVRFKTQMDLENEIRQNANNNLNDEKKKTNNCDNDNININSISKIDKTENNKLEIINDSIPSYDSIANDDNIPNYEEIYHDEIPLIKNNKDRNNNEMNKFNIIIDDYEEKFKIKEKLMNNYQCNKTLEEKLLNNEINIIDNHENKNTNIDSQNIKNNLNKKELSEDCKNEINSVNISINENESYQDSDKLKNEISSINIKILPELEDNNDDIDINEIQKKELADVTKKIKAIISSKSNESISISLSGYSKNDLSDSSSLKKSSYSTLDYNLNDKDETTESVLSIQSMDDNDINNNSSSNNN